MKRCLYYASLKTVTILCIFATLGCHSQVVPAEKPTPTEKDTPQGISNLLPNGGALLFLCTCSQCKTTIKALEPLLSA